MKGARRVVGLRPWQKWASGQLRVTAVPALHMATTIGFVVESADGTVYFAGDTYHRPFLRQVGERFDLDVALLPVATYRIPMTMGEAGAVKAARDLRPRTIIPVHRDLSPRSPVLPTRQSAGGFARRIEELGVPTRVALLEPGDSWTKDAA